MYYQEVMIAPMVINPRSIDPAWKQVGQILANMINTGKLPKGERIPSEAELMSDYQVGRTTARKAVEYLRDLGLVETQPGRGTYVRQPPGT